MDNNLLYKKIDALPERLKKQVEEFIDSLNTKNESGQPIRKAQFGSGKGMFAMHPDFDAPLEDFKEYMY